MNYMRLIIYLWIVFISSLILTVKTYAADTIKNQSLDWQALQFTCTKEQNPTFDDETEAWFKRARALEKTNNAANDPEMIHLYQQAANRDHNKAILNLARLYAYGIGVAVDEKKAVDLVEKAMKLNSAHAYYSMGTMLQQGIGVKQDKIAALSYFRRSADMGNRYGQQATGEAIRDAFLEQPEPDKHRGKVIAVKILECALAQDHAEAGYFLGRHYLNFENNPEHGLFYLQKAASLGHVHSIYKLSSLFKTGKDGVIKDPERASCYDRIWEVYQSKTQSSFPEIDSLCPLPPLVLPL